MSLLPVLVWSWVDGINGSLCQSVLFARFGFLVGLDTFTEFAAAVFLTVKTSALHDHPR